jgi:hypothetical protein
MDCFRGDVGFNALAGWTDRPAAVLVITIGEFDAGEFKGLPNHSKGRLICFRCFTLK